MVGQNEAQEYLGICTQTLEIYVNYGKLNVRYQLTADREIPLFDRAELENLRLELQAPQQDFTIDALDDRLHLGSHSSDIESVPAPEPIRQAGASEHSSDLNLFDRDSVVSMPSSKLRSGFLVPSTQLDGMDLFDRQYPIVTAWGEPANSIGSNSSKIHSTTAPIHPARKFPTQMSSMPFAGIIGVFLLLFAESVRNSISQAKRQIEIYRQR